MRSILDRVKGKKHLAKDALIVLIGQVLFIIGGLFSVRVTTTYINPSDYGSYALALSIGGLLLTTAYGGTSEASKRFYEASREGKSINPFLKATWDLANRRSLAMLPFLVAGFVFVVLLLPSEWTSLYVAAAVWAIASGYNAIPTGLHLAAKQRVAYAIQQALRTWLNVLFIVVLVGLYGANGETAMWSVSISMCVSHAIQYLIYRKTLVPKDEAPLAEPKQDWNETLKTFAWPYVLFGIPVWAYIASQRWALEGFAARDVVGQYAVLVTIGTIPIMTVFNFAIELITPYVFAKAGDGNDKTRSHSAIRLALQLTGVAILVLGSAIVIATFFHRQIFELLADEKYHSYSAFLPFAVISGGLPGISKITSLCLQAGKDSAKLLTPRLVSSGIGTVIVIVLTYSFGLNGVLAGTVIHGAIFNGLIYYYLKKKVGYSHQKSKSN